RFSRDWSSDVCSSDLRTPPAAARARAGGPCRCGSRRGPMPDLLAVPGPVACLPVLGLLLVESGLLVGVVLPGDSLRFGAGLLVGIGRGWRRGRGDCPG